MPLTYSKIKKQDKSIVYLIDADGTKVKLEAHYNTISGTYMGVWVNSPIEHDNVTDYLKTTAIDRETLLNNLPETLGCPRSAVKRVVEVGDHEFEKFPANVIKTSAGLFKLVIDKVNTRYGAPMGRESVMECPVATKYEGEYFHMDGKWHDTGKTFDRRVELDSGGYDAGGAYWGRGTELRVTYNEDLTFVRFYRR